MRIKPDHLSQVTSEILRAAGVDEAQAQTVTENLIWSDMVGRQNHGVERLPILIKHIAAGTIKCPPNPTFEVLSESVQKLEADQAFGHHAGRLAVDRASAYAKKHGVGIVGVNNSNFFGAGAYYADLAAQQNMAALVLSNSFPKVATPGGLRAALGTNPFAFGVPRRDGKSLLIDMSTAAVAGSTVREKAAKGELFSEGVAIDSHGTPILDPNEVSKGTLLPAAGAKGFGLAMLVEILSAVLTGAAMSHQVGSMYKNFDRSGQNGHFVMALDIARWMPMEMFFQRIESLSSILIDSGDNGAVRLPGDARWKHYAKSVENGIELKPTVLENLKALAQSHKVDMPW